MQKILWSKRHGITIQCMVEDNPTPGTLGSHQLLLEQYIWLQKTGNQQMLFNTYFLRGMLSKHKKLHCVYCGRKNLRIYHWMEYAGSRRDMATADHFVAKSIDKDLAMEESNLRVACFSCNTNKDDKYWKERFPYPKIKEDELCTHSHGKSSETVPKFA